MLAFMPNSGNSHLNDIKSQLIVKNHDNYVKQAFNLPEYITHILESKNPIALSVLNNFASKRNYELIDGGDIKGAIDKLKCEKVSEKDLIQGVTNDLTEQLKNKEIELEMKSKMSYSNENAKEGFIR